MASRKINAETVILSERSPDASRVRYGSMGPGGDAVPRVLLIQEDRELADTFRSALAALQVETAWAQSGLEGLARARLTRFDLLVVDLDLPDIPGVAVISALRATDEATRLIVLSGSVTAAVARDALGWGAVGVLGKPLTPDDVMSSVGMALRLGGRGGSHQAAPAAAQGGNVVPWPQSSAPRSVAERWAVLMLRTIDVEGDPKTLAIWARSIGVSRSALCECCRLMHVSPHHARDFARIMRVIHRSGGTWQPEALLDLADARTLKKLLTRAGLARPGLATPSLAEFLECQQWIPKTNPGLVVLRGLLLAGQETYAC